MSLVNHIFNNYTYSICLLSAMSYAILLLKHVAVVRTDLISKLLTQKQMVISNIAI